MIHKMNVEDPRITPVTPGQRVVWRGERAGGGNGMMGVPLLYRLHGDLVVSDLAAALDNLMSRHAALRTTFVLMSRKLNQTTHPPGLAALYRAQRQGGEADLPEIKWQYADYASWRQQNAASDDVHREYVIDLLRGAQF